MPTPATELSVATGEGVMQRVLVTVACSGFRALLFVHAARAPLFARHCSRVPGSLPRIWIAASRKNYRFKISSSVGGVGTVRTNSWCAFSICTLTSLTFSIVQPRCHGCKLWNECCKAKRISPAGTNHR